MAKIRESGHRANLIGSIWMITAMAAFAIEDVFVKAASTSLPVSQILIMFGTGGALLFAIIAKINGDHLFNTDAMSRAMRFRMLFEIFGRLFYILAIALTPLSAATVILQATPIVVVACAAFVFHEKVGWRRWTAILIGLLGVVIIIQPGTGSFSTLSILAVLGMFCLAGRDLASRAAPSSLSTSVLGVYGFVSIIIAGFLYSFWESRVFVMPDIKTCLYIVGAVISGIVAYSSLMKAMRTGEVSAVTPFRYSRLLFGVGFGVLLFDEQLDISMLIGCGLIVLSGLFLLWRGTQIKSSKQQ